MNVYKGWCLQYNHRQYSDDIKEFTRGNLPTVSVFTYVLVRVCGVCGRVLKLSTKIIVKTPRSNLCFILILG